jgi:hypothetical protein
MCASTQTHRHTHTHTQTHTSARVWWKKVRHKRIMVCGQEKKPAVRTCDSSYMECVRGSQSRLA